MTDAKATGCVDQTKSDGVTGETSGEYLQNKTFIDSKLFLWEDFQRKESVDVFYSTPSVSNFRPIGRNRPIDTTSGAFIVKAACLVSGTV